MGLLLRDCYDFGIGNVPGPNLGIPLVIHQGRDTIEDTLRKAVAAAEKVFGRGKPKIIFVCLPVAGECAQFTWWNEQGCLVVGCCRTCPIDMWPWEDPCLVTACLGTLPWDRH